MPIIKSAIKRMRQTATRRTRNVHTKRELRDALKTFNAAVTDIATTKKADELSKSLNEAFSKLDIAVKKNVMHKNTAARKKAQLTARAKAAGAKPAVAKKTAPAKAAPKAKAPAATKATPKATAKAPAKKPAAKKPATKKTDAK